jgi:hypothetical protein
MFASPTYYPKPDAAKARIELGGCLTTRQLAFERFLKHISSGTLAVVMLIALALLSPSSNKNFATRRSALTQATDTNLVFPQGQKTFHNPNPDSNNSGNICALSR